MDKLLGLLTGKDLPNWAQALVTVMVLVVSGTWVWIEIQPTFFPADDYYQQYQNHIAETADVHTFDDAVVGNIAVHHYPSDGCLLIMAPGRQPKWLPVQTIDLAVSPLAVLGSVRGWHDLLAPNASDVPLLAGFGVPQDYICVDCWQGIHPGEFRMRYGDEVEGANGWIWVEVWREFEDGCVHFQMQREDGYMDMNVDGSPRVCWVRCVHK